jgi:peptidoglycan/LPS O-acetylase OafA/YrhL
MEFFLGLLLEFFGQLLWELLAEFLFGLGDAATGGRMKRVLFFGAGGALAGACSVFVRPSLVIPDSLTRYAAIAALTLAGGAFLALFESRVRRGGPGAATGGFLSGVAFSLAYVLLRRSLLV